MVTTTVAMVVVQDELTGRCDRFVPNVELRELSKVYFALAVARFDVEHKLFLAVIESCHQFPVRLGELDVGLYLVGGLGVVGLEEVETVVA